MKTIMNNTKYTINNSLCNKNVFFLGTHLQIERTTTDITEQVKEKTADFEEIYTEQYV